MLSKEMLASVTTTLSKERLASVITFDIQFARIVYLTTLWYYYSIETAVGETFIDL